MKILDFDYAVDPALIAQYPACPRDRSRLLVLYRKTGKMEHRQFYELLEYLEPGDLLVVNDTKVFAARLNARKEKTGGSLNLLLIRPIQDKVWLSLVSGKYKIGQRILFEDHRMGEIVGVEKGGQIYVRFHVELDFHQWLSQVGKTPLPPYIKRSDTNGQQEMEDRQTYQTVYGIHPGSIAAPTAGLHFTESLLDQLHDKGIGIHPVTLHVGPGTFKPVRVSEIERHTMEAEYVQVPISTVMAVRKAKESGKRVVAVGTTTVRALESAVKSFEAGCSLEGFTGLFIMPGYRFKMIDSVITNFHLPCTTLLMLVAALTGRDQLLAAYREAMRCRYRFYSFGDAMLIL
jgi:S-adenosylmethionine:tRNA ribosyltransferase-isomerase